MAPKILTLFRCPVTGICGGWPTRLQVAYKVESWRKLASSLKIRAQSWFWAFFKIGIDLAVPAILQLGVGFGQNPSWALHRKAQFMQQLAHMAGVVVHSELLLNHPRDHGRGPDSGVQAIGHRAAVQDVLQGLLVRATQLRRSSAALSFQQTFDAMGFITCQPLGNLGAWGLQNRRQLPAAAPLRIQHYCLQPLGHAIGSVSFRLFAQTNQPLIGAGVQTNHSRKHGTPPKASMPSFFCYVPLIMRICIESTR